MATPGLVSAFPRNHVDSNHSTPLKRPHLGIISGSPSSMNNIFLYLVGFAGTGKLTIARAFARHVGAKVVDNQWINNPIFGLIDPDGVTRLPNAVWSQTAKVREAVLETIATLAKPGTNFVFTHDGVEGEP